MSPPARWDPVALIDSQPSRPAQAQHTRTCVHAQHMVSSQVDSLNNARLHLTNPHKLPLAVTQTHTKQ